MTNTQRWAPKRQATYRPTKTPMTAWCGLLPGCSARDHWLGQSAPESVWMTPAPQGLRLPDGRQVIRVFTYLEHSAPVNRPLPTLVDPRRERHG